MPLQKRNRDGNFVSYNSLLPNLGGTHDNTTLNTGRNSEEVEFVEHTFPPKKKARKANAKTDNNSAHATLPSTVMSAPVASTSYAMSGIPGQTGSSMPDPPAKGRKKKGADPANLPEKREARFRKQPPQNILERLERVRSQTFYMIDRKRVDGQLSEEFSVLGSTGNVYTVTIDKNPRCSCPDSLKGNHCKHIIFIFIKVLQVPETSGHWYQKALLTDELQEIFSHAPLAPNSRAHSHVLEAYSRAMGKAPSTSQSTKNRIPGEDDDCPICYDTMYKVAEAQLNFCDTCGNALHKACFEQYKLSTRLSGKELTCVWCRANLAIPGVGGGEGARVTMGGYLNLAGVAGISPRRDTSTYYRGPTRGRRGIDYDLCPGDDF